jgi:hypothetical protein
LKGKEMGKVDEFQNGNEVVASNPKKPLPGRKRALTGGGKGVKSELAMSKHEEG